MAFELTLNSITSPIDENDSTTLAGVISGLDVQGGEVTLDIDWGDSLSPPQNQQFTLKDDGSGADQTAGDGIIQFSLSKQYLDDNPTNTPFDTYDIKVDAKEEFLIGQDVVFVIDVSGSTGEDTGIDFDEDGSTDTVLDAEVLAFKAANQSLIDQGLGNIAKVSISAYSDPANLLDMDPTGGVSTFTTPLADLDNNGVRDVDQTLMSLSPGGNTNFEAGLQQAIQGVNNAGTQPSDGSVIFLSDGLNNRGGSFTDEVNTIRNTLEQNLRAFGVGTNSSLTDLQDIDPDAIKFDDLQDFLDFFNGTGEQSNTDSASKQIQVDNVAPSVSINLSSARINEDGFVTVTGRFSDPGTLDTHTATINWGDGTGDQTLTLNGDKTFSATYQYLDDGPFGNTSQNGTPSDNYTITVAVTDDDTDVGKADKTLIVNDVAPELSNFNNNLPGQGIIVEGDTLELSANYTDVGTKDFHEVKFEWGDGAVDGQGIFQTPLGDGVGNANGSHTYTTAGSYTATLTVTDDDTLAESDSVNVTVAKKVDLDWKPGSNPSSMNFTGGGTIPVAILGAVDFDVTQIDVASIRFDDEKDVLLDGGGVRVNLKNNGNYQFSYEDTNFDGYTDMVAHVSKVELGSVVNPDQDPFLTDGQIYAFGAYDSSYFFGMQQAGDPIVVQG